jgi:NADH-quinone oxidoreductase subunit J
MALQAIAFYLMAASTVAAGFAVVSARNPVHSVLFLILAFFSAAGLFVLMGAEFLAMLLVVVYVGAVAVLFLFVVMMLDINIDSVRKGFWKHFPLAGSVGAIIALEMSYVLMGGFREPPKVATGAGQIGAQLSNTKELGKLLYSEYLYPLEVAAVILLVAIIAAIALTLRARKDSKYQNPSEQIRVKRADRVSLVKMKSVVAAPLAAAVATPAVPAEEKKA